MIKKIIIRVVVLIVTFLAAIFIIGKVMNQNTPDLAGTMRAATLPLVYMLNEETQLNSLHGYAQEMDVTALRDALTPIGSERTLDIQIRPYQNKISGIRFQVMTADGTETLEKTKVTKIGEDENYINATLELQNKTLINTEYMLEIVLTVGGRDVYYYTRILQEDGLNTQSYLNFVMTFYESCINGNDMNISEVMEPNEAADNTTYAYANIHNETPLLVWKGLNVETYYRPTPTIRELNQNTATIAMDYMISATDDDGKLERYYVTEYYRMRYTDTRIMLLDFERETNQVFNPENRILTEKGINLGISSKDITHKNDLKNNYYAFVREGALWCYDVVENKIVQIFSFPQEENSDTRDMYNQNSIEIINIDEKGNMYFLVCGYMNRGNHEGESGVAVYYYEEATATITESLFVNTKYAFSLLERDVKTLAYISEDRQNFYIVIDGNVYAINMETKIVTNLVEDISVNCYAGAGASFAWLTENDLFKSTSITMMNMETQDTIEIKAPEGTKLRILGFIEDDLVYGLAKDSDIDTSRQGNEYFPISQVLIVNAEGEVIKTYEPKDSYVFGAVMGEQIITLTRMEKSGNQYLPIENDHIVSSVAKEDNSAGINSQYTERKKTEMILGVGQNLAGVKAPQIVKTQLIINEGVQESNIKTRPRNEDIYYVYAKGSLDGMYQNINQAVIRADEMLGVVVNGKQQVVWERGNKKIKLDLDPQTFPRAFMQYTIDVGALQQQMEQEVIDLSGCTLEQIMYFVSQGTPVLAKTLEGVVIIGGYDEFNMRLLYEGDDELSYYGLQDSTALFEEAGNVFVTYLNPLTE